MNRLFSILALLTIVSCNTEKASSKIKNQNPSQIIKKKLSGVEIINHLEGLGFFSLTDTLDIAEVKEEYIKSFNELKFFGGASKENSLDGKENRFVYIDCEELFEIGGLEIYLKSVKPVFDKLNLNLNFKNEKSEQTENFWKHTIQINNNEHIAYEGDFSGNVWGIAFRNFIEMLNYELRSQNSQEQFYPFGGGNECGMVLLSIHQFDFILKNYPFYEDLPTTLSSWEAKNQL